MTFDEFIDKLENYPCEWHRNEGGMIRAFSRRGQGWEWCPITWVCYKETGAIYDILQVKCAARDIGLLIDDRNEIVNIADTRWTKGWPKAWQLAKACGLKEGL